MIKIKAWLKAFRLRTLPLSLSSIILAGFLAASQDKFRVEILCLAILCTLFLQILSNLANDLGDSISGADNKHRIGPKRSVQAGEISRKEMKYMLYIFTTLSLITGIILIYFALQYISFKACISIFIIGLLAIAAAINYTIGKKPYGYSGYGDISVFIFFGLVGVLGTYLLQAGDIKPDIILPATAVGLLSVGVLNLNNMRDIENDKASNKITLVVKIGLQKAKKYHIAILILAMLSAFVYSYLNWNTPRQMMYILSYPLIIRNMMVVLKGESKDFDPELKKLAMACLFFAISFGYGTLL